MRKIVAALALALLLAGLWWASQSSSKADQPLRILFSGESLGRLDACICEGQLAGGLAFREGFVQQQKGNHLLLDTGCVGAGRDNMNQLQTEAILRRMKAMGYIATNIGESELLLGANLLARHAPFAPPYVSANVIAADTAKPIEQSLFLEREGRTIAITGIVEDDRYPIGPGLTVTPYREALARLIPQLRKQAQTLILLADLDLPAVREVAQEFPELTLILFRGRNDSHAPERVNRAIIASIYGGRYMGDLTLQWETRRKVVGTGEAVLLDKRFAGTQRTLTPPAGLSLEPTTLDFGRFQKGKLHKTKLKVINSNDVDVELGRVYSPCTCFVLGTPVTRIPAKGSVEIDVTLHSLTLTGSNTFPLYIEIRGSLRGILTVQATATVLPTSTEETQP